MDEKELAGLTRRTAEKLFGTDANAGAANALWGAFDAELGTQFSQFIIGRLYAREVLPQKARELCAVASLAAGNRQSQLYTHADACLRLGATRAEVAEVLFQVATYAGVPCMVEGLATLKKVLQDRGEWKEGAAGTAPAPQPADGLDEKQLMALTGKTAAMLFGPPQNKGGGGAFALWKAFDAGLARQVSLFFSGRLYSREVLSQKQRELCAVAALATRDMQHELHIHADAALRVGATRQEVAEVLFQVAIYAGVPCMVEGLGTLKKLLQERGEWAKP